MVRHLCKSRTEKSEANHDDLINSPSQSINRISQDEQSACIIKQIRRSLVSKSSRLEDMRLREG